MQKRIYFQFSLFEILAPGEEIPIHDTIHFQFSLVEIPSVESESDKDSNLSILFSWDSVESCPTIWAKVVLSILFIWDSRGLPRCHKECPELSILFIWDSEQIYYMFLSAIGFQFSLFEIQEGFLSSQDLGRLSILFIWDS